jgi:cyclopropane-fatty-acyl-phospholipid synthase
VPCDEDIVEYSGAAGFSVDDTQLLDEHYVRTLDTWAANLEARRNEAIAATSAEVYERYMRYLTGCSDFFNRGISELGQFTLTKS